MPLPGPQASSASEMPAARSLVSRVRRPLHERSLAFRLLAVVLALVVPLNALIVVAALNLTQAARDSQRSALLYSARSVAAGLDAALDKFRALAEALARSPSVLEDDPAAFGTEAGRTFAGIAGASVVLADVDGRQLFHSAAAPGAVLPVRHPLGIAAQRRAFETGRPALSDVRIGPVLNTPVVSLDIPVFRNEQPFRSIAVTVTPDSFLPLLSATDMPRNWLVGIIDAQGHYVARIPGEPGLVGEPASDGWRATAGREGVFEFISRDGDEIINANATIAAGGWTVGVAVKKSELGAAVWQAVRWSVFGGILVSLASLLLAVLLARRVGRDVRSAGDHAAALLAGREVGSAAIGLPELAALSEDIAAAAAARRRIEQELERRHAELAAIYDTAQVGLCVFDRELRFVRINRRLAEINGLAPEAHIGRGVRDVVPALAEMAERIRDRILATGRGVEDVEITGTTAAQPGRRRVWLEQWTPLKDAAGGIIGLNVAVEEITERKEAEAGLARQADRQRRLLDITHALIGRARDERETAGIVFDSIAPALDAEVVLCYRVDADGSGLDLVFSRGIAAADVAKFSRLAMGEAFCGTVAALGTAIAADSDRIRTDPKGAYVAGLGISAFLCQPLRGTDGRVLGTLSVGSRERSRFTPDDVEFLQTVTNFLAEAWQRIDSGRRVADNERLLRSVLDGTLAFIAVLDPDGTLREANRQALLTGGLARADVVGRKFWDCRWWSDSSEEVTRLKAAVGQAARGEPVRYDAVVRAKDDSRITVDFMLSPVTDAGGRVVLLVPSAFDISDRKIAEDRQRVLMRELGHRGKNLLAVIQAIAGRTLVEQRSVEAARAILMGRLQALAATFATLTEEGSPVTNLRAIVENELKAFGGQSEAAGPAILVSGKAAQTLALVVHELATNASKYGALSVPEGRVAVEWSNAADHSEPHVTFAWIESGGPPAATQYRKGFGTALVCQLAGAEFRCAPQWSLEPTGLQYRFTAPLSAFKAGGTAPGLDLDRSVAAEIDAASKGASSTAAP